jgi:ABC-type lipoprotein export system ATPase subunit
VKNQYLEISVFRFIGGNDNAEIRRDFFLRKKEYASLQSAYRPSMLGSPEVVTISGAAGTGKSALARELGRFITANKGVFLVNLTNLTSQSLSLHYHQRSMIGVADQLGRMTPVF